jgi:hypothetical protein
MVSVVESTMGGDEMTGVFVEDLVRLAEAWPSTDGLDPSARFFVGLASSLPPQAATDNAATHNAATGRTITPEP